MESFLPGIGDWHEYYYSARRWHFMFNGTTAEKLVAGRERIYLDHFWNDFAADPARSVSEDQRARYTAAYARPGRMRAAWTYFATIPETARRFGALGQTKLVMPVLVVTGAKAGGAIPGTQVKLVASRVETLVMAVAPMPVYAVYRGELRRSAKIEAFVAYLRAALPTAPNTAK